MLILVVALAAFQPLRDLGEEASTIHRSNIRPKSVILNSLIHCT